MGGPGESFFVVIVVFIVIVFVVVVFVVFVVVVFVVVVFVVSVFFVIVFVVVVVDRGPCSPAEKRAPFKFKFIPCKKILEVSLRISFQKREKFLQQNSLQRDAEDHIYGFTEQVSRV